MPPSGERPRRGVELRPRAPHQSVKKGPTLVGVQLRSNGAGRASPRIVTRLGHQGTGMKSGISRDETGDLPGCGDLRCRENTQGITQGIAMVARTAAVRVPVIIYRLGYRL